jgi:hypothetical protein
MPLIILVQTEMHATGPPVPETSYFGVQIAIEKLKRYKSPGINQIPAELNQAEGNALCSEVHKCINCTRNNYHINERNYYYTYIYKQ